MIFISQNAYFQIDNKILVKVDNKIITNYDLLREIKTLLLNIYSHVSDLNYYLSIYEYQNLIYF